MDDSSSENPDEERYPDDPVSSGDETDSQPTSDSDCPDGDTDDVPQALYAASPTTLEATLTIQVIPRLDECTGYRVCGDNIDKNVKARYLRADISALFPLFCC